jgi:hypothetical protein
LVWEASAAVRSAGSPSSASKPLSTTATRVPSPSAASVNSVSVELPGVGSARDSIADSQR